MIEVETIYRTGSGENTKLIVCDICEKGFATHTREQLAFVEEGGESWWTRVFYLCSGCDGNIDDGSYPDFCGDGTYPKMINISDADQWLIERAHD